MKVTLEPAIITTINDLLVCSPSQDLKVMDCKEVVCYENNALLVSIIFISNNLITKSSFVCAVVAVISFAVRS